MSVNNSSSSCQDSEQSLCFNVTVDSILSSLSVTRLVLLIPISIFILHLGIQQWRQHRSFKTLSHSDIFTYNLAVLELIWSLGIVLHFGGVLPDNEIITSVVYFLYTIIFFAETSCNVLTCVDRYLAVVHPVKYRELRNTRAVTIRNISMFFLWFLSLVFSFIFNLYTSAFTTIMFFSYLVASLLVVFFCSLSVLCVLFKPGPGKRGGNGGNVDQSKQRAFCTVMAIMGVLCLFFLGFIVGFTLLVSEAVGAGVLSLFYPSLMWISLPSSLVLPLFYLQKAGKLRCGHQSGR